MLIAITMPKKRSLTILLTTVLRLLSALLIYIRPIEGMVIYILLDSYDSLWLEGVGGLTYKEYQRVDKAIDVTSYLMLLPLGLKYDSFIVLLMLLLFRIVGTFLFYLRESEYYLILFPNLFLIYLFFVILIGEKFLVLTKYTGEYYSVLGVVILGQILIEVVYHFIYPNYLQSGVLRQVLSLFGYNSRRKI